MKLPVKLKSDVYVSPSKLPPYTLANKIDEIIEYLEFLNNEHIDEYFSSIPVKSRRLNNFTKEELYNLREWYNYIYDTNKDYLEEKDNKLFKKICRHTEKL